MVGSEQDMPPVGNGAHVSFTNERFMPGEDVEMLDRGASTAPAHGMRETFFRDD